MKQRTYDHYFNSPSKVARENLFYLESAGHYCCDKSFFEDSYYKQNYYLIYVISGKGFLDYQGEPLLLEQGQLVFLDLSQPYKYYSHKKTPWEFQWMLFGGNITTWYHQTSIGSGKPILNIAATSTIPNMINEVFNLCKTGDPFFEVKASKSITDILTSIYIESMINDVKKKDTKFEYPDPIKIAINFIEQNYFRKIQLEELASITFLSPYYLLRLFKKFTGFTPGEYINKYRLDFSKRLLLEPELTIEQIALNVGFYTHSYFSKMFKRSTGLTPEQFRQNYSFKGNL